MTITGMVVAVFIVLMPGRVTVPGGMPTVVRHQVEVRGYFSVQP